MAAIGEGPHGGSSSRAAPPSGVARTMLGASALTTQGAIPPFLLGSHECHGVGG